MTAASLLFVVAATAAGGAAAPAAPASAPAAPASAPAAPFPRKDVAALVKEVFAAPVPFCTNPRYPLTPDDVRWCALIPKQDARCPALARACNRGATAELVGQRARSRQSKTTIHFPSAAAPVRVLLWILLAVGVGFLIYLIARQALAQRRPDKEEAIEIATAAPDDTAAAVARQIETDVQRLLERARAAAARGDFGPALDDAYAALLRKLEGSGIVSVESHRTNGDHVRDVGRQLPALRPRMQAVVSNVEEVQFGGSAPTESRFRSVLLDVVGLLGERLAACVPFIVAVGLTGLLAGCGDDRDREHSVSGRVLVIDLLKRYGFSPRERLAPLAKADASVSSLLLLPDTHVDEPGWQAVARWVGEGGTLIVAGGEHALPDWIGARIVSETPSAPASRSPAPLTVPPEQADRLPRLTGAVPEGPRVEITTPAPRQQAYNEDGDEDQAPPLPLIVRGKALYAVERTYDGGGRAIVLADDELLNNVSLLVDDNARLLVEVLRPGGQKLELAGELTGLVAQDPITAVQRGRLAPAILQLLLLIGLFYVYKGAHFGRPVDPIANSRRAFSEHARAIGMQYGRRRAGRHALEIYGSYALDRMRERLNLTGGKGLLAVAEEVATRTGRPLGDVMRVLVESRPPNQRPADPERDALAQEANAAKDLATLRDISTLLSGTGGAGERIRSQRQA